MANPLHPKDCFHDVRQFLLDLPEACFLTCYNFSFRGKKVPDLLELQHLEGLVDQSEVLLVPDFYTEKDAKVHVRRTKNLLEADLSAGTSTEFSGVSVFTAVSAGITEDDAKPFSVPDFLVSGGITAASKISAIFPRGFTAPPPKCYNSLNYSSWNPPPSNRQLQGDLFYLVYESLEKKEFHITANNLGFFLNGCTHTTFNPTPNADSCFHTLFDLLSSIDRGLQVAVAASQEHSSRRNAFETVQSTESATSWCVPPVTHIPHQTRAEDHFATKLETIEAPGQLRDWNEEFQGCRELPQTTIAEKLVRERALHRSTTDFVDAARKGAIAVVEGNVPSLNPTDPHPAQMFLYNNIFLSFAVDGRDTFKALGGDNAAHVAAAKDLFGVTAINTLDMSNVKEDGTPVKTTETLYTPLTALIDYKGVRVVAQSMIPGVLRHDQTTAVRYGGIDAYKEIRTDPEFHSRMVYAGEQLHLAKHVVVDSRGTEVELGISADVKGIVGGDERMYALDLYRNSPMDANFVSVDGQPPKMGPYIHQLTFLRLELLSKFFDHMYVKFIKGKVEERAQKQKEQSETTETGEPSAPVPELREDDFKFTLRLNADIFSPVKLGGSEAQIAEDTKLVVEAGDYLLNVALPQVVAEILNFQLLPIDSTSLKDTLHSKGINIRYLGKIVQLMEEKENADETGRVAKRLQPFKSLCIREMITRATKHIFRAYIAPTPGAVLASRTAYFLNCFLGDHNSSQMEFPAIVTSLKTKSASTSTAAKDDAEEKPSPASSSTGKKKKKSAASKQAPPPTASLPVASALRDLPQVNHLSLWKAIRQEVKARYLYDLPLEENEKGLKFLQRIPALRAICKAIGVQILARDYDFSLKGPVFAPSDIVSFFPITKSPMTRATAGETLYNVAKTNLSQGNTEVALALLNEAVGMFQQVYGPIHARIGLCLSELSLLTYRAGDIAQAIVLQERSLIISERICGLDSQEVAHHYTNLGVLYYSEEDYPVALRLLARARSLQQLVYGRGHPVCITAESNIAMMLQTMGEFRAAHTMLKRVVEMEENCLGPEDVVTASGYHALANNCGMLGEYKEGIMLERIVYGIYSKAYGTEDTRTKESSVLLNQLAQNAVLVERTKKELQWSQPGAISGGGSASGKNKNKKKK